MIQVTVASKGAIRILGLTGQLDAGSAPVADKRLLGLIEDGDNRIVLDLAGLTYLASAGIRTVISSARMARIGGGDVYIAGAVGFVSEVIEQCGLGELVRCFATPAEAAAAFPA